jgi:hypothetical protein
MPEFSLHKLVLQLGGMSPLSIQSLVVLLGKLLLFSYKPEEKTVNKMNPVNSKDARQMKKKRWYL